MDTLFRTEELGDGFILAVSEEHTFGTDAFLLADFSHPRHKDNVADFGTGCGIIAMLMAKNNRPKQIYAIDLQNQAIEQLKEGLRLSPPTPIIPVLGDIRNLKEIPLESLDLITCNPPYKAAGTGILSNSEADQIARHETEFSLNELCSKAASLLKFGGRLCLCQRPERLCDVISAMRKSHIEPKRLRFVSKTSETAPWLILIEGKKGAKPFLQVEPNLTIYNLDHSFSEEYLKICHYGTE